MAVSQVFWKIQIKDSMVLQGGLQEGFASMTYLSGALQQDSFVAVVFEETRKSQVALW